ncbi:hypothetical protein [Nocardia exalbida]|uniref:hypothetical protein n=1 Tax=Nocardia exalbida TaxID=290231 RepID=UPI00146141AF|nr:hypothetical protein [Nocardia exalbida]
MTIRLRRSLRREFRDDESRCGSPPLVCRRCGQIAADEKDADDEPVGETQACGKSGFASMRTDRPIPGSSRVFALFSRAMVASVTEPCCGRITLIDAVKDRIPPAVR